MDADEVLQLATEARRLTAPEVGHIERALRSRSGGQLADRLRLAMCPIAASVEHVLWLIENEPAIPCGAYVGGTLSVADHRALGDLWIAAARASRSDAVLINAALFLFARWPREAIELLRHRPGTTNQGERMVQEVKRMFDKWSLLRVAGLSAPAWDPESRTHRLENLAAWFRLQKGEDARMAALREVRDAAREVAEGLTVASLDAAEVEGRLYFRHQGSEKRRHHHETALGLALLAWGDADEARACLMRAGGLDPVDHRPSVHLAMQLLRTSSPNW